MILYAKVTVVMEDAPLIELEGRVRVVWSDFVLELSNDIRRVVVPIRMIRWVDCRV